MKIYVTVKQLGKKKAKLNQHPIELAKLNENAALSDFISILVEQQVAEFNARLEQPNLLPILNSVQIKEGLQKGKVDFGSKYNSEKEEVEKAQANALLAFEDGLFAVFVDDEPIDKLNQQTKIKAESVVTFIRLTFLSGSWF